MTTVETDFDAFRDDFVLYLANRLGVSKDGQDLPEIMNWKWTP